MDPKQDRAASADQPEKTKRPMEYEIRIAGALDPGWTEWFPAMRMTIEDSPSGPLTILRGMVPDQSSLRGILGRLWDLGLTILRVERIKPHPKERRTTP